MKGGFVNKMRTMGSMYMIVMLIAVVGGLMYMGQIAVMGWTGAISMIITVILASILASLITKKKESLFAYVNIFLTFVLLEIIIIWVLSKTGLV